VFESVLAAATFCLVPLHLPKPQRGKNVAGAGHAPTDGFDNLTGAHLFVFSEYRDYAKGNGIVAFLFCQP